MGFPVGYSELLLPKILLNFVFLLGFVRRLISWAFDAVGLGDLLDPDLPWPEASSTAAAASGGHGQLLRRPGLGPVPAALVQEALPVVRFGDLAAGEGRDGDGDSCAVCLCEFEAAAEVRRLSNCRHVFHRACLDRWIEHDQRTCPLCRSPLVSEESPASAAGDQPWASSTAGGVFSEFYYDYCPYYSSFPALSSSMPSPTLLLTHQLLSSSI